MSNNVPLSKNNNVPLLMNNNALPPMKNNAQHLTGLSLNKSVPPLMNNNVPLLMKQFVTAAAVPILMEVPAIKDGSVPPCSLARNPPAVVPMDVPITNQPNPPLPAATFLLQTSQIHHFLP